MTELPRSYAYRCEDKSRLSDWIARVLAPPVQRLLPRGLTPNDVTAIGSALCWLAAGLVWLLPAGGAAAGLTGMALLWAYCVLDHVDGLHARLTGRSSAWGEYLDHALDAWNVALVTALICLVQPGHVRPETVLVALALSGLATAGVWLEQHERGCLYLGHVGPVEAVLLAGLYLASWSVPGAAAFWAHPLGLGQFTRTDGVLLAGALGSALCAAAAWRASPASRGALRLLAAEAAATILLGGLGAVPWLVTGVVLAMSAAIYAGRVIAAYLSHAPRPRVEWLGPLGLLLVALAVHFAEVSPQWAWLVPAVLALRAIAAFFAARRALRPAP